MECPAQDFLGCSLGIFSEFLIDASFIFLKDDDETIFVVLVEGMLLTFPVVSQHCSVLMSAYRNCQTFNVNKFVVVNPLLISMPLLSSLWCHLHIWLICINSNKNIFTSAIVFNLNKTTLANCCTCWN
jgi:hypothetical protein